MEQEELNKVRQALLQKITGDMDWDTAITTEPLENIVALDLPYNVKFSIINVPFMIQENVKEKEDFNKLLSALKILKKYAKNLQKPAELRPPTWHTIMYSNGYFRNNVDTVKGARDVLKLLGYEVEATHGLVFEEGRQPQVIVVGKVIMELLVAVAEIEHYLMQQAPYPHLMDIYLPPAARIMQHKFLARSAGSGSTIAETSLIPTSTGHIENTKAITITEPPEPCDICGSELTRFLCNSCSKWLCADCDTRYHKHPKRVDHVRYPVSQGPQDSRRSLILSRVEREPSEGDEAVSLVSRSERHTSAVSNNKIQSQEYRNSMTEHSGVEKISTSQLPVLRGVFSPANSAELVSNQSYQAQAEGQGQKSAGQTIGPTGQGIGSVGQGIWSVGQVPKSTSHIPQTIQSRYPQMTPEISSYNMIGNGITMMNEGAMHPMSQVGKLAHPIQPYAGYRAEVGKLDSLPIMLLAGYTGPKCKMLNQVQIIQPFDKQREVLDMLITKFQTSLPQTSDQNMQQQLHCLVTYRNHWDMVLNKIAQESTVPSITQTHTIPQTPSPEVTTSSGNLTFVININSQMNQLQQQQVQVLNAAGAGTTNTASHNASSMAALPSVLSHRPSVQPQESTNYPYIESLQSKQLQKSERYCEACGKLSTSDSMFCQFCGNRIISEENFALGSTRGELESVHQSITHSVVTQEPILQWQCGHCTYRNNPSNQVCEMCERVTDDPTWFGEDDGTATPNSLPQDPYQQQFEEVYQAKRIAQDQLNLQQQRQQREIQQQREMQQQHEIQQLDQRQEEIQHSIVSTVTQSPGGSPLRRRREVSANVTPLNINTRPLSMLEQTSTGLIYNLQGGDMSRPYPGVTESVVSMAEPRDETPHIEKQARSLASQIRDAEINNYSLEEFELAVEHCEDADPLDWLSLTWNQMVEETRGVLEALACDLDPKAYTFTDQELRTKLASCHGDVDQAAALLISERQKNLEELQSLGTFSMEEISRALQEHHGQKDRCEHHLVDSLLAEFKQNVWLPDPGIDEQLEAVIRDKHVDYERRGRLVLVEGFLKSWGRVETVLYLLDNANIDPGITLDDIIDAANECGHKAATLQYLQQECQICFTTCSRNKIMNLAHCQCQVCRPCMQEYFEVVIRERPVRDLVCPVCLIPDIQDPEQSQQHFQFLDLLLRGLVAEETMELYQRKVRDWILMQDPQFRWCSHCDSGFLYTPEAGEDDLQMACPHCNKETCYLCKRPWEEQHKGLTCEEFAEWKIANDPEHQAAGLARHLQEHGIECPSCKFRYVLSRGGCMHFKCTQCLHEFCSGCYKPFKRQNCQVLRSCAHAGLHCHHPRDCLFYLRDYEISELQTLLQENSVDYKTESLDGSDPSETCPIVEQKEMPNGLVDESCGKEVPPDHAGLCPLHYKEYLVELVNTNHLDPVSVMTTEQLELQLSKNEKAKLKKRGKESVNAYRKRLINHVQNQIPLSGKQQHQQPRR